MNRSARLQSARSWLPTYTGNNIAAGYRKHFGVDWLCAFKELETLGVKIDPGYKQRIIKSVAGQIEARKRRKAQQTELLRLLDQDESFAYIAGYTEAGFAYGLTWEELEEPEEYDSIDHSQIFITLTHDDVDDIPF